MLDTCGFSPSGGVLDCVRKDGKMDSLPFKDAAGYICRPGDDDEQMMLMLKGLIDKAKE